MSQQLWEKISRADEGVYVTRAKIVDNKTGGVITIWNHRHCVSVTITSCVSLPPISIISDVVEVELHKLLFGCVVILENRFIVELPERLRNGSLTLQFNLSQQY